MESRDKPRQETTKIDPAVRQNVVDWLETPEAKEKGFNSVARFMTIAASELLEKHTKKRFEHFNFADNVIRLIDNEKPAGTAYIEIALMSGLLICRSCESKNCIHIKEIWNHTGIVKQLERMNLKKSI